jgi:hypothetical protein
MKQSLVIALTVINAGMLAFSVMRPQRVSADAVAPIVRARAFELVDEQGRLRGEIKVFPAEPSRKMPDGTVGYPETVMLRMFSSKGAPNVKLVTVEDGSGMVLGGERGSYSQFLSRGTSPFIKLVEKAKERTITP